jgi:hypothetical protein
MIDFLKPASASLFNFLIYICSFIVLYNILIRAQAVTFTKSYRNMTIYEWVRLTATILICCFLSVKVVVWML